MNETHAEIVVIKRHGGHEEEHHGGAWKIAFADFMTAMMAFFLVLWIINATDKDTKTIIARYFNPVKLEDTAKARKGIRDSVKGKVKGDVAESDADASGQVDDAADQNKADQNKDDSKSEAAAGGSGADADQTMHSGRGPASVADPARPKPTLAESSLFKDPYASLDEIAGKPKPPSSPKPLAAGRNDPITSAGTMDADAFRDPFQPIARAPAGDILGDGKSEAPDRAEGKDKAPVAPPQSESDPAAHPAPTKVAPAPPPQPIQQGSQSAAPAPGVDANRTTLSKAAASAQTPAPSSEAAHGAQSKAAVAQPPANADESPPPSAPAGGPSGEIAQLRGELLKEIGGTEGLKPGPGLEVQMTDEGLLISLTDQFDFSMFPVGSAEPQARVVHIMEKVAEALKNRPGAIILRGFTDGRPYRSAVYDNWRLSAARAQMAYYMLVRGGLPEKRVERIEGYADRRLRLPNNPAAAENRRIEILLRRPKA
jgi:chemotaxis protein MotB